MRASRLVNLLLVLQTRGSMTAADLARELEVSQRTVYRDVDALSQAGIPIYAERGPHGGVRLVEGYRTRLTGLTTDEAEALFLSGLPGPAAELGLGTVVAAARLKVLAALPPELRARASRVNQRFHLDAPGWFQASQPVPHLETLAAAVWEDRRLEIEYRRPDRAVRREVDPLGLVLKGGVWYLVGRSSGQDRTYRVSRILDVVRCDERFERPTDFDLAAYWGESTAAYERERVRYEIVVRLDPAAVEPLADIIGAEPTAAAVAAGAREADGRLRLRLAFDWDDEALSAVFRLAPAMEVVEPAALRASVLTAARGVLERHAGGS